MGNVLLVTRNFAPTSHVSVERATKLAKYLPEFGWRPTVLTGARATVGLPEDPELLDQVPGVEVIRARAPEFSLFYGGLARGPGGKPTGRGAPRRGALHPKSWLVPDSQLLWYPFAVRAGPADSLLPIGGLEHHEPEMVENRPIDHPVVLVVLDQQDLALAHAW